MSMTFYVKNKKKLLGGLAPVMSVEEALRLVPNLSQFNANEDDEEFDAEGFYGAKLSELDCLIAGAALRSATKTAHITSASARLAPAQIGRSR